MRFLKLIDYWTIIRSKNKFVNLYRAQETNSTIYLRMNWESYKFLTNDILLLFLNDLINGIS